MRTWSYKVVGHKSTMVPGALPEATGFRSSKVFGTFQGCLISFHLAPSSHLVLSLLSLHTLEHVRSLPFHWFFEFKHLLFPLAPAFVGAWEPGNVIFWGKLRVFVLQVPKSLRFGIWHSRHELARASLVQDRFGPRSVKQQVHAKKRNALLACFWNHHSPSHCMAGCRLHQASVTGCQHARASSFTDVLCHGEPFPGKVSWFSDAKDF